MTIRAISLFSGAGGMDLGFRRAGVKVVWANDFNASACETYKANFGNEIHCGSLMDFDYNALPDCDLVFGGPPCQGFFSNYGETTSSYFSGILMCFDQMHLFDVLF